MHGVLVGGEVGAGTSRSTQAPGAALAALDGIAGGHVLLSFVVHSKAVALGGCVCKALPGLQALSVISPCSEAFNDAVIPVESEQV